MQIRDWIKPFVVSAGLIFSSALMALTADDITYVSEDYPPFNYRDNDAPKGFAVDLLDAMLHAMSSKKTKQDVRFHPWARGYYMALNTPGTVLFSTTRSAARESLFKWVGPIAANTNEVLARKDRHIKINNTLDLLKYRIAVVRDDIGETMIINAGIPANNRETLTYPELAAKMLDTGRIDLWCYGQPSALWVIKNLGLNTQAFESVYNLGSAGEVYYAFHRDTPDTLIQQFQTVLDQLKQPGREGEPSAYTKILQRYTVSSPINQQ
ncbi:MAG: ABC transporter substrate-binding protein [Hahellaceae bacterium]|nr:ABC transporter substrate-binding protein [Hahellaceae bacterium]MCP5169222.1 ABC transporter substrate-binding protein [Hahellaceae bacterium]